MKIQLIDINRGMCEEWEKLFSNCEDVTIKNGDIFSLKTDCIVSPANSFGYMDGGLDYVISDKVGWSTQNNLQKTIQDKYNGELLVGQAELIETDCKEIPFCISAPTMRVPSDITGTVNAYLATRAVFLLLRGEKRINTVTISGMGTGCGYLQYDVCAKQMKYAYDSIILGNGIRYPYWRDMQEHHYRLTM